LTIPPGISSVIFLAYSSTRTHRRHEDINTGRRLDGYGVDGVSGYGDHLNLTEFKFDIADEQLTTAYAVWFDYKRQSDPDFRKNLKRSNRRMARAEKEEAEAQGAAQREEIKKAVSRAKDEGFPTDLEEKEAYFMGQVAKGEGLCAEGRLTSHDAMSFFRSS
jgi:hypothetical protein